MSDERPYTTQRESFTKEHSPKSPRNSLHSTSLHQAAYAMERARMLFGSYRRGDANDPETYVTAVSAVLSRYEADLIREVTDPRTGVQTTEKFMTFMPNAGELKVYCDGVAAHKERMKRYAKLPRSAPVAYLDAPEPQPGDRANLFVPNDHPRYSGLVNWSTTADPLLWKFGRASDGRLGIWVAWHIWDDGMRTAKTLADAAKKIIKPTQEAAE